LPRALPPSFNASEKNSVATVTANVTGSISAPCAPSERRGSE
jgi:hypothetical protein